MDLNRENIKKEKPFQDDGFTIVEIVVVMILIMVAIWPMGRVIASALEASHDEQHLTHCAFLAQMKMEEVRARSLCYSTGNNCPETGGESDFENDFSAPPLACGFHDGFANYECTVEDSGNLLLGDYNMALGAPGQIIAAPGQCIGAQMRCFKAVRVRVWYDRDGDGTLDSNEPQVVLESFVGGRWPI